MSAEIDYIVTDVFRSVLSKEEGLKYSDIKCYILPYENSKYYFTDGERIFRVWQRRSWLHTHNMLRAGDIDGIRSGIARKTFEYLQSGMYFYEAHIKAFNDYFIFSYKEIHAKKIKIYISNETAESLKADGVIPCYKTLNGSRNKYLNYANLSREILTYCAFDIDELKAM